MYILCADTSGAALSFTLAEKTDAIINEICSKSYTGKGKMNELFFSSLDTFLNTSSVRIAAIDRWISVTGPGSFTGIRIGVAAISGITLGLNKEHIGISALDAAALISGNKQPTVAASIRLNEYAVKHYNFSENIYSDIELQFLQPTVDDIIFVNGKQNTAGFDCLTKAILHPEADAFYRDTAPVYVKRSEAEINFDKKSSSK